MPAFDDSDFEVQSSLSPIKSRDSTAPYRIASRNSQIVGSHGNTFSIPVNGHAHNVIEIPATRSSMSDTQSYMHNLSLSPSMKERRGSQNSFGASLPIPRPKWQSRLSSVHIANGHVARPGMPPIQPSRDILAAQVQDMAGEKAKAVKDMAFVFDIDGVLVHGDRLIPEGQRVLEILNGNNELGIKIPHIFLTNSSGKPELACVQQLSQILHSPISTEQFIQSHTPMCALAEYYKTVLTVGGESYRCREVAEEYGFQDIIVPKNARLRDPATFQISISMQLWCSPIAATMPLICRSS